MIDSFGKSAIISAEDENINGITKRPVWISRKILLDLSGDSHEAKKYPSNDYSSCKYNLLEFFLLAIWTRCKRVSVMVSIFVFFLSFSVESSIQYNRWITFGFTLILTILPPLMLDLFMYAQLKLCDKKINNKYCIVFDQDKMEFVASRWKNLKVGDIVCVLDGEQFPADVVVLHSSGKRAYISSEMVNGSRLVRTCEPTGIQTDLERAIKDFILAPCRITCDVPSGEINHFEGSLKWEGKPRAKSLTIDNFAQMFSRLRFASWALGIVVYAGTDTRVSMKKRKEAELKSGFNPLTRLENTVSMVCITIFVLVASFGINVFTVKKSTFESFTLSMLSSLGVSGTVHAQHWQTVREFAVIFSMFVPITLTFITDAIRIIGFFRFPLNEALRTDHTAQQGFCGSVQRELSLVGSFAQESSTFSARERKEERYQKASRSCSADQSLNQNQEQERGHFQNQSRTQSLIQGRNLTQNQSQTTNWSFGPLDLNFHNYQSLDSLGHVDISLICQSSMMDSHPMSLKIISLNGGKEYCFNKPVKVNESPKFSIVSGLLWRHHSLSGHWSEYSNFSNGSLKVIRTSGGPSSPYFRPSSPSGKLELFHYFSVLLAISGMNAVRGHREKRGFGGKEQRGKYGNKKKIRSYYKKFLFQIRGLNSTFIDEPPDPTLLEQREVWPPLPRVRVAPQQAMLSAEKSMSCPCSSRSVSYQDSPDNGSYLGLGSNLDCELKPYSGSRLHPALPVHLFPKRIVRLLNHIVLSNKRKRISLKEGAQRESKQLTVNLAAVQGSKDYRVFDTKGIQINREENEEILYLLFNNIVKLTKSFYGWNTNRRYKLPNEYSQLVKSLLLESINYSLSTSFWSGAQEKFPWRSARAQREDDEQQGASEDSVLVDVLYAMAVCNSTVPHLRITKSSPRSFLRSEGFGNSWDSEQSLKRRSKHRHSLGREFRVKRASSSIRKLQNYHEIPKDFVKKSILSFKGFSGSSSGAATSSSLFDGLGNGGDWPRRSCSGGSASIGGRGGKVPGRSDFRISSLFSRVPRERGRFFQKPDDGNSAKETRPASRSPSKSPSRSESFGQGVLKKLSSRTFSTEDCSAVEHRVNDLNDNTWRVEGVESARILHRYNKNVERLHKQRREGNVSLSSREILLTKCYLNYHKTSTPEDRGETVFELMREEAVARGKRRSGSSAEAGPSKVVSFSLGDGSNTRIGSKCLSELKRESKKLRFAFRVKSREERIREYVENFPKAHVQYSGIDETDLTIVHTAASCGMRLVLANSQFVVVESLGRTVFSSLVYRSEDKAKQEVSLIVRFCRNRDATLYVRGVAEHILPLLNPLKIRCQREAVSGRPHQGPGHQLGSGSQSYDDLLYKVRKLQYQGYKVFIFARKRISEEELQALSARRGLAERADRFRFLLDSSAEEYFQSLKTRLEYLGHVGVEFRIQEKVPESVRSFLDSGIKPWFLFEVSSANSVRLVHKIFPRYDKIPLIRLDRLPLRNKGKAATFLSAVYNELSIIAENKFQIARRPGPLSSETVGSREDCLEGEPPPRGPERGSSLGPKSKGSDLRLLGNLITISTLGGEIQLSQLRAGEEDASAPLQDWLSWAENVPGSGTVNSLPGLLFSGPQLGDVLESRDLANYFFSILTISPFVIVSNATSASIQTLANFLKNNVFPRPLLLGISGNTGNVPVLSSCDVSVSVSLTGTDKESALAEGARLGESDRRVSRRLRKTLSGVWGAASGWDVRSSLCRRGSSRFGSSREIRTDSETPATSGPLTASSLSLSESAGSRGSDASVRRRVFRDALGASGCGANVITPVADFYVERFHQVVPLLTRVGRLTSQRVSLSIFGNVFKMFLLMVPNLLYQLYCQGSGTVIYGYDALSVYLLFWTVLLPVSFGATGTDVPRYLQDLPYLYSSSRNGYYLHWANYLASFLEAGFLGTVSFYLGRILTLESPFRSGISPDISILSGSVTIYCFSGTLFSFLAKTKSLSASVAAALLFKVFSTLLVFLLLEVCGLVDSPVLGALGLSPSEFSRLFVLTLPLFVSALVLYNLVWKIVLYHVRPDPATLVRDWWLIHLQQSSRVYKRPLVLAIKGSFLRRDLGGSLRYLFRYIRVTVLLEWVMVRSYFQITNDRQDEYVNFFSLEYVKVPVLSDTFTCQYHQYFMSKLQSRRRQEGLRGNRFDRPRSASHRIQVVNQPQVASSASSCASGSSVVQPQ
ncbi:adenylate and guanylate cyclase catalytic domain-containing protein, partial [Cryptosporidium felis]